ncbi:MAG TPA: type IV secretion system DNA-binding domain-containing protein [Acidimicrobiales bacterium]|jgi:hypothetical protein|nr:type IV secretion system DNA-binding domain-containing protein [Acidimicrobiales bacterium]
MAASLWLAVTAAAAFVAGVLLLRAAEQRRINHGARSFCLRFPRDMAAEDVTVFVAGLAGVRPPWYWHWLRLPTVSLETHATAGQIDHYLFIPKPLTGIVLSHLRAALPSVRVELAEAPPAADLSHGIELRTTSRQRPLRTDRAAATSAALLTTLLPLRPDEQVVVQWLLTPALLPRPLKLASRPRQPELLTPLREDHDYDISPHGEALRAARAKQAEATFSCVGRIAVKAAARPRARYLLQRIRGAYELVSAPGIQLDRRLGVSSRLAARYASQRRIPLVTWPVLLNAAEISAVMGWPVGVTQLPGLVLGACRQLPPAADLPSTGCVVARATFPGAERPVAIQPADRLLHTLLTGPTGSGKSNLLLSLITQDMQAGRSVVVVDPKGDLVTECLKRVPAERVRDVIVLDPGDEQRPVGMDLLTADQASAELVAEQTVFIFHQLFSAFWGPRTDDVLRAALLTLMSEPGMTLVEVPLLLTNAAWRRRFVANVQHDSVGLGPFWSYYEGLKPNDQAQVIAPLMNKLRATLLRSRVRNCVGQAEPLLKLGEALDSRKLLFVPLRQGVLGDEAAALMGSLFVSRVWQTVQARSAIPEAQRQPVHFYIDEVQNYLHLPSSVGDMLAAARGLGLGLTVAHQHLGQLSAELLQDLLANCRSKVVFQTTAKDAHRFEQEFTPYLTAADLQGLGRFEVVAQLAVNQRVAPPVTGVTLPPPEPTNHAAAAKAWSRQHYGRDRQAIEADMQARHGTVAAAAPVGRAPKRRSR